MNKKILQAESKSTDNLYRAKLATNKIFELIILPTELCNFRCKYCYEDFSIGRMKKETITGIKALLRKRCANLNYLNISWFGGEPLTAKDIVLEISEYASILARKYSQLSYKASMTTNGYFLDIKTANTLAKVGVKHYQISLDGPRDVHNKSRIRADGNDTYDQIWGNLIKIRDSSVPVSVMLRIHFTVDTFELLDPLLKDIRNEFLHDPRFSIFFKAIERMGGPNDASINIFSSEKQKRDVINLLKAKLYRDTELVPPKINIVSASDVCYAARPNSLVIRANGDIGKCTVALNDERNKIGSIQQDGSLKLVSGRLAPWVRGIKTLDPMELGCPLINLP